MFLCPYANTDKEIIIVCVLNFHLDIPTNRDTITFTSIIELCGTYVRCCYNKRQYQHTVNYSGYWSWTLWLSGEHKTRFTVTFSANVAKPPHIWNSVINRKLRSIDIGVFKPDIVQADWTTTQSSDVDQLLET